MIGRIILPRETFRRPIGESALLQAPPEMFLITQFSFPNRYNEPQRLEMKNVTKADTPTKENRMGHLMTFLAGMKTGTKVFQHFLSKSNLSLNLEGMQIDCDCSIQNHSHLLHSR